MRKNKKNGFTLPNFSKKNLGGFTLIELLVVIAIIGILAGIVLVALSGARNRAKDARITSDMAQIRTVGEFLFSSDGNYDNIDCALGDIKTLCDDIASQGPAAVTIKPASPVYEYCAEVELNSGQFWCVDSELISVQGACTTETPFTCIAGAVGGGGNGGGGEYKVFVTSVWYRPESIGSLLGADLICQSHADAVPLGGTWKAWLSDSAASAASRLVRPSTPIYRIDGVQVAANWADLTGGTLDAPIQIDENNNSVSFFAYTGTYTSGSSDSANNCSDWTSNAGSPNMGRMGNTYENNFAWTSNGIISCNNRGYLYCFSQSPI